MQKELDRNLLLANAQPRPERWLFGLGLFGPRVARPERLSRAPRSVREEMAARTYSEACWPSQARGVVGLPPDRPGQATGGVPRSRSAGRKFLALF